MLTDKNFVYSFWNDHCHGSMQHTFDISWQNAGLASSSYFCDEKMIHVHVYRQLRARRALWQLNDVPPLKTRKGLSLYKVYANNALLVLNGISLNINALLALSQQYFFWTVLTIVMLIFSGLCARTSNYSFMTEAYWEMTYDVATLSATCIHWVHGKYFHELKLIYIDRTLSLVDFHVFITYKEVCVKLELHCSSALSIFQL